MYGNDKKCKGFKFKRYSGRYSLLMVEHEFLWEYIQQSLTEDPEETVVDIDGLLFHLDKIQEEEQKKIDLAYDQLTQQEQETTIKEVAAKHYKHQKARRCFDCSKPYCYMVALDNLFAGGLDYRISNLWNHYSKMHQVVHKNILLSLKIYNIL